MGYILRPYQQKASDLAVAFFLSKRKTNEILVLPTGAGKSLIVADIASRLGGHTLILQPNKEILEQNYEKYKSFGDEQDSSIFSASLNKKEIKRVTFATIGSIIKKKEMFEHFDRLIIDECHLVNHKGGMYEELINHLGKKCIGLTATPYRLYNWGTETEMCTTAKMLHRVKGKIFSKILYAVQVQELFKLGYLSPIKTYKSKGYQTSKIELNSTGRDYDRESLIDYNRKYGLIEKVVHVFAKIKPKNALVFCTTIEESENLQEDLNEAGIKSACISSLSKKKEREKVIADFLSGEIQVIVNVGVLTTGFDFPELECVILARPTMSVSLYYQMVGRGLRIFDGKEKMILIDLCENYNRFGCVSTFKIMKGSKGLDRLRSNKGWLTGINFLSGYDLESGVFGRVR